MARGVKRLIPRYSLRTLVVFMLCVPCVTCSCTHCRSQAPDVPVGRFEIPAGREVTRVCLSRDGRVLFAGDDEGGIHRWRVGGRGHVVFLSSWASLESLGIE